VVMYDFYTHLYIPDVRLSLIYPSHFPNVPVSKPFLCLLSDGVELIPNSSPLTELASSSSHARASEGPKLDRHDIANRFTRQENALFHKEFLDLRVTLHRVLPVEEREGRMLARALGNGTSSLV